MRAIRARLWVKTEVVACGRTAMSTSGSSIDLMRDLIFYHCVNFENHARKISGGKTRHHHQGRIELACSHGQWPGREQMRPHTQRVDGGWGLLTMVLRGDLWNWRAVRFRYEGALDDALPFFAISWFCSVLLQKNVVAS